MFGTSLPLAKGRRTIETYVHEDGTPVEDFFSRVDKCLSERRCLLVSGRLFQALAERLGRDHAGRSWVVFAKSATRRRRPWQRMLDIVVSALALVALSPFLVTIAVLVKLSSPGPIFYSTTVVGEGRRQFTWFKFRSMRVLSHAEDERRRREKYRAFAEQPLQGGGNPGRLKVIDDSRVTRVGMIIRKFSLDELPQLYNVVKGQMSLVGPRPCLPYEAEMFPQWAVRRFEVRPGLTGIWQVCGRGRVSFEEALAMDVYYVYARSLWLDLRLMVRTVGVVLRGEGAR